MHRNLFSAVLAASLLVAPGAVAQNREVPEFLLLQRQYEAQVKGTVDLPFQVALRDLNEKYSSALDREVKAAQQRGRLNDVLPFAAEKALVDKDQEIPKADDAATPAVLKQMRVSYRASHAKLVAEKDRKLKPLMEFQSKTLTELVARLTRTNRIADAAYVEQQRLGLQQGPDLRIFAGTWVVSYSNIRSTRRYRIHASGQVDYVVNDKVESTIRINKKGRDFLLDFSDGKIERISVKDGTLHVDHYNPASRYPDGGPTHTGTGQKVG